MEEVKKSDPFSVADAELWAVLEHDILPHLISQSRKSHLRIQIWVAECATGIVPYMLVLLLARLLGPALTHIHPRIFATDHNEADLAYARRGIIKQDALWPQTASEVPSLCEPVGSGYRLPLTLRKLLVFGRHDLWHDPVFSQLDLILCGFCLHAHSMERQERFLSQVRASHSKGGYLVCSRQDTSIMAHFPYTPLSEGLPIYQPLKITKPSKTRLFAEHRQADQKEVIVEAMHDLLQAAPIKLSGPGEGLSAQPGASAPVHSASDVLVQLAPMGIVVLDHHYQILSCNRAAHKLLLLLTREDVSLDFFHATPGLPYQAVRTAIDTVMREGTSHTLAEVELMLTEGGNGRVLRIEIYSIPTEAGSPSQVVLYLQDVTMQTAQKKVQLQQAQFLQDLSITSVQLQKKYNDLERAYQRLHQVSHHLLIDYQELAEQLEEMQEAWTALELEVEELRVETAVLTEQEDQS